MNTRDDVAEILALETRRVLTPAGEQPPKHARHIRVYVRQHGRWRNVAHQATAVAVVG